MTATPDSTPAAGTAPAETVNPQAPRRLQAGLVVIVLALAVAGYAITGAPGQSGLGPRPAATVASAAPAPANDADASPAQVAEVVEQIVQRLKEQPENATGWALLARAYAAMGRHTEAVPAFERAVALAGEQADLLADQAEALAALNNGELDAQATNLVTRALAAQASHPKARVLAGGAAFNRRDYAAAIGHWEQALRGLPPNSPVAQQVVAGMTQARQLGGGGGVGAASAPAAAAGGSAPAAAVQPRAAAAKASG